jgi:WD40 repeat protein
VPGSWDLALCRHLDAIELWQLQPTRRRWRADLVVRRLGLARPAGGPARVVAVDADATLVVLDVDDGAEIQRAPLRVRVGVADSMAIAHDGGAVAVSDELVVNVIGLDGAGSATAEQPCPDSAIVALGPTPTGFVAACRDGTTRIVDHAGGTWRPGPMVPAGPGFEAFAAAESPDGRWLAIGGLAGGVLQLDLATGAEGARIDLGDRAVARVAYLPGAPLRLLVGTEHEGTTVFDAGSGVEVLRLPDASSRHFRAMPDGVVAGGTRAGRWQLDEQLRPRALRAPAGLSSVAVTADRRWIAAGRGDGQVSVWDGRTGAVAAELAVSPPVVKSVAFSPAGDRLAISHGGTIDSPSLRTVGDWGVHRSTACASGRGGWRTTPTARWSRPSSAGRRSPGARMASAGPWAAPR